MNIPRQRRYPMRPMPPKWIDVTDIPFDAESPWRITLAFDNRNRWADVARPD